MDRTTSTKKTTTTRASPTATANSTAASAAAELAALIAEDAANVEVTPDVLAGITAAAQQLKEAEAATTAAEDVLKAAKQAEFKLRTEVLPALMDGAGVAELVLETGERLVRDQEVFASISKDNMPVAAAWFVEHDYGDLITSGFAIEIPKGDTGLMTKVRELLTAAKLGFEETNKIHAQTLKAFVKESLEKAREMPKAISYHIQPEVVLKKAKSKKGK